MKNCIRNHYFVAFFATLIVAVGLLITSFFLPPQGSIDPSVLQGTAIVFCWPALAFAAKALDDNKRVKIDTKVGTITVGHPQGDDAEVNLDETETMEGEENDE